MATFVEIVFYGSTLVVILAYLAAFILCLVGVAVKISEKIEERFGVSEDKDYLW